VRFTVYALAFLALFPNGVVAQTSIDRRFDVPPIRMTYRDLDNLLQQIITLIDSANAATLKSDRESLGRHPTIKLSISAGGDTIFLSGPPTLAEHRALPETAYGVRFSYRHGREAPIDTFELTFTDRFREIHMSGTKAANIDALTTYVQKRLDPFTTRVGGDGIRLIGLILLVILAMLLLTGTLSIRGRPSYANFYIGGFLLLSIFIFPWDSWLAGTAIYSTTASFLDRNINVISLVGVVGTILSVFLSLYALGKRGNAK